MRKCTSALPFQAYSFIYSKEKTKTVRDRFISSRSKYRTSKPIHLESSDGPAVSKKTGIFALPSNCRQFLLR